MDLRPPQPVRRNLFEYDGALTVNGFGRVEPDEVKRLIFEPKDASTLELAEWKVEHKKTATKAWLFSQLLHHGARHCYYTSMGKNLMLKELRELALDELVSARLVLCQSPALY